MTVTGANFGAASLPSSVKIGSTACILPLMVTPHTEFSCKFSKYTISVETPSSQGLIANVTFQSRITTSTFNYDVPAITGISSTRSTAGGSITIFGSDFGMLNASEICSSRLLISF